jgi:hypothetical protein
VGRIQGTEPCMLFAASFLRGPTVFTNLRGLRAEPELTLRPTVNRHIFFVALGLERGPLSLVRINEELLERKVAAPV